MISKLILKNYRQFKSLELEFKDGINIILGPNETGKSTVLSGINSAIYRDATTKAKSFFNEVTNWETKSPNISAELIFSTDEGSVSLKRDFKSRQNTLKGSLLKTALEDPTKISQFLHKKFYLPLSEDVFRSTSFVAQSEVTGIKFNRDIQTQLERVSATRTSQTGQSSPSTQSNSDASASANLKTLVQELRQLELGLGRPSKNHGALKSTQDQLQKLTAELEEKRKTWEQAQTNEQKGEESGDKLEEIGKKISEIEAEIERHKLNETAAKELQGVEAQLNSVSSQLARAGNYTSQIEQLQAQMQAFGPLNTAEGEAAAKRLQELSQSAKLWREDISDKQADAGTTENKLDYIDFTDEQHRDGLISGISAALTIAGVAVVGIGEFAIESELATTGGLIVTAFGVTGLISAFARSQLRSIFGRVSVRENSGQNSSDKLQEELATLEAKISQAETEQAQICAQYGVATAAEFFANKAKLAAISTEYERAQASVEAALGGAKLDELQAQQAELASQKAQIETTKLTPEVKASKLAPTDYLRKRRELDMLNIERKRLERETTTAEVRVEQSQVQRSDIVSLEEQLAAVTARQNHLERRRQVLSTTIKIIEEVIASTGKKAGTAIAQEVNQHLPKITQDRYHKLRLTPDYKLQVYAPGPIGPDSWLDPIGNLSQGTVDQIYLLSRIALAKHLLGGQLNYLFLDDPFVNFDDARLKEMQALLQEIAKTTQVFIFSHNQNYANWGNAIQLQS